MINTIQDQIPAMKTVQVCALDVMMATHFLLTGEIARISEAKNHLVNLTEHELTMLIEAIDDQIHKCDE